MGENVTKIDNLLVWWLGKNVITFFHFGEMRFRKRSTDGALNLKWNNPIRKAKKISCIIAKLLKALINEMFDLEDIFFATTSSRTLINIVTIHNQELIF